MRRTVMRLIVEFGIYYSFLTQQCQEGFDEFFRRAKNFFRVFSYTPGYGIINPYKFRPETVRTAGFGLEN